MNHGGDAAARSMIAPMRFIERFASTGSGRQETRAQRP
jgi:hypothetical protein